MTVNTSLSGSFNNPSSASTQSIASYTDLAALNDIKISGREDSKEGLRQVAKQFESLFVNMMLKSMREANKGFAEGSYLNSNEMEFYQQNFDNQLSLHLTQGEGIGLADVFYRQMLHQYEQEDVDPKTSQRMFPEQNQSPSNSSVQFDSPQDFVSALYEDAHAAAEKIGVPAEMLLAQSALETGWGKKIVSDTRGNLSHNMFGIKADSSWQGTTSAAASLEYENGVATRCVEKFRHYDSFRESFHDYVDFLQNNPRYESALRADADSYIEELQKAGYATDPNYAEKVRDVMGSPAIRESKKTLR